MFILWIAELLKKTPHFYPVFKTSLIVLIACLGQLPILEASTSVRNGGDSLQLRLRTMRSKTKDILEVIRRSSISKIECSELSGFNDKKCGRLVGFTKRNLRLLSDRVKFETLVPFIVLDQESFEELDDQLKEFAAYTNLSSEGPIWFSRAKIAKYSPGELFGLIIHEFLHKIEFEGEYIEDDQEFEGFLNGRDFIDSLALLFSLYAKQNGLLGGFFITEDLMQCRMHYPDGKISTGRYAIRRKYSEELAGKYSLSLGDQLFPELSWSLFEEEVYLKVNIDGFDKCSETGIFSNFSLIKKLGQDESAVLTEINQSTNPVCNKQDKIELEYNNHQLVCSFVATQISQY